MEQQYLEGRKAAPANIGRVLILGLGKSGKSAARYCADLLGTRVERLFIAAGARTDDSAAFVDELAPLGAEHAFGDDALDGLDERFDLCIASPGIPCWHALYRAGAALSAELVSEVEFAWRESAADSTWVAITGTNGKTTTTSLAAHVLRSCGFAAAAVGNIGDVCLDAVVAGDTRLYVAEVSSYQLYSTPRFAPDVAVLLNITPDHLHWHQSFEAYRDAKYQLLENLSQQTPQERESRRGALPRAHADQAPVTNPQDHEPQAHETTFQERKSRRGAVLCARADQAHARSASTSLEPAAFGGGRGPARRRRRARGSAPLRGVPPCHSGCYERGRAGAGAGAESA